jgi:hypothetical protein
MGAIMKTEMALRASKQPIVKFARKYAPLY